MRFLKPISILFVVAVISLAGCATSLDETLKQNENTTTQEQQEYLEAVTCKDPLGNYKTVETVGPDEGVISDETLSYFEESTTWKATTSNANGPGFLFLGKLKEGQDASSVSRNIIEEFLASYGEENPSIECAVCGDFIVTTCGLDNSDVLSKCSALFSTSEIKNTSELYDKIRDTQPR